jgi:sigma-E factor negative regulatory protein RseC
MLFMNRGIQHAGIVEKIEHPRVYVRIVQQSACSECHAKTVCSSADSKMKTIEIEDRSGKFEIDEEVLICGHYSTGMYAVWLAFVLPLILIVLAAVAGTTIWGNEIAGGLTGLFILIPYYGMIYLMRDRLKRKFVFTLSKNM